MALTFQCGKKTVHYLILLVSTLWVNEGDTTRGGVRAVVLPIAVLKLQGYANADITLEIGKPSLDTTVSMQTTVKTQPLKYVTDNPIVKMLVSVGVLEVVRHCKQRWVMLSSRTPLILFLAYWCSRRRNWSGFFEREQEVMMELVKILCSTTTLFCCTKSTKQLIVLSW